MKTDLEKEIHSLDISKIIMALCVIAIHTEPLVNCKHILFIKMYESIVACAVPFFFVASGYLLVRNLDWPYHSDECLMRIRSYLYRIVKMYLVWSAIYLPLAIYKYVLISGYSIVEFVLLYIKGLLLIGESYNSWMLWYLLSTIYALLFIYFGLRKKIKPNIILVIGSFLFLLGEGIDVLVNYSGNCVLLDYVSTIIKLTIAKGRIFSGGFYIPLGMMIATRNIARRDSSLLLFLGFVSNVLFEGIVGDFALVVCIVGFFNLVLSISLPSSLCYATMRRMSTVVYFIHMYIWTIYYSIVYHEKTFGLDSFVMTSVISLIVAYGFACIEKSIKSRAIFSRKYSNKC